MKFPSPWVQIATTAGAVGLAFSLIACVPHQMPPGDFAQTPEEPQLTADSFVAPDGYELPLRTWPADPPSDAPRAVIIALHGFNDYSNAFAAPGEWLADRNFVVYAFDQRGFGATADPGMWPGTQAMIDDLRSTIAVLRDTYPGVPLYALGESMGGSVVLAAWEQAPLDVDGAILVGPAVWGRAGMPSYMQTGLWMFAHTVPWLKLTGEGFDFIPSDNFDMLRALGRDPLIIKETRVDAMWGLVNLMDTALNAADDFDAPALIMTGVRDEIVPPRATQSFLTRLRPDTVGRQTVAIYESGYHMLLRDLSAELVWRDIASWIDDPAAPLPSGADRMTVEALDQ